VIVISFLVGLCLMWILDMSTRMGLRRQVRKLEKELTALRAQTGYEGPTSLESYTDEPFDEESEPAESDGTLPK
jgi:hypothetical protein